MFFKKFNIYFQFFFSVCLVLATSAISFLLAATIGYKIVALILLMAISLIAMVFEILPVLFSAFLSALIWNYFFIPPIFTFHIGSAEDLLMFSIYFVVALLHTVLTFKIKEAEKKVRDKEEHKKSLKLYDTLFNSLSHELKTPISTIMGAIDILKEKNNKLTRIQQFELLAEIDKASIRLHRQVENLLNMGRLESGMLQLHIDWVDVNELIYLLINKSKVSFSHKIEFLCNPYLPLFKLDGILMENVLHNILHNALLYTSTNTVITIDASFDKNRCIIVISDNGLGFPEHEIAKVFNKFHRLPNSKAGGSGLGLSIVQGFVEAMNGKIILKNNITGGALFRIEIPSETTFLNNLKNE